MNTEKRTLLHILLWALVPYNTLVGVVQETMQPTKIAMWAREPTPRNLMENQ